MPTKPIITNKIAIYEINIVDENINKFCEDINKQKIILKTQGLKTILVSLKDVKIKSKEALLNLSKFIAQLQVEFEFPCGYINYSDTIFITLNKFSKATNISAFKNLSICKFALGLTKTDKSKPILIFLEDQDESSVVSTRVIEDGYQIINCKSKDEFVKRLAQKENYSQIIAYSCFGSLNDGIYTQFTNGIFFYAFRGATDKHITRKIHKNEFHKRVETGNLVHILDLTKMTSMDSNAANYICELKNSFPQNIKICIYGYNEKQFQPLVKEILRKGQILFYNTKDEILTDSLIMGLIAKKAVVASKKTGLSILMVKQLNHILEGTFEALQTFGVSDIKKGQIKPIFIAEIKNFEAMATIELSFAGDIDGVFTFLFSKEVISKLMFIMTGEDANELALEEAKDAMGEFVNIIAGQVKTVLSKNNTPVNFSIPTSVEKDIIADQHKTIRAIFIEILMENCKFRVLLRSKK